MAGIPKKVITNISVWRQNKQSRSGLARKKISMNKSICFPETGHKKIINNELQGAGEHQNARIYNAINNRQERKSIVSERRAKNGYIHTMRDKNTTFFFSTFSSKRRKRMQVKEFCYRKEEEDMTCNRNEINNKCKYITQLLVTFHCWTLKRWRKRKNKNKGEWGGNKIVRQASCNPNDNQKSSNSKRSKNKK